MGWREDVLPRVNADLCANARPYDGDWRSGKRSICAHGYLVNADPYAWSAQLDTLYNHAWQRLIRGVHDRHAPARHPTLATVSPDGLPQARTVVLRRVDQSLARIELHTHIHSLKSQAVRARPVAALHVWDVGQKLQIRLEATVDLIAGAAASDIWSKVPEGSRSAYAVQAPGLPIDHALAYESQPNPSSFAVLILHVQSMDLLHLGPSHRRAVYERAHDWSGRWVVP